MFQVARKVDSWVHVNVKTIVVTNEECVAPNSVRIVAFHTYDTSLFVCSMHFYDDAIGQAHVCKLPRQPRRLGIAHLNHYIRLLFLIIKLTFSRMLENSGAGLEHCGINEAA